MLEVRGLCKSFFGVPVLRDVELAVHAGEALGLVGENGSGKSTSMNLVGGLHRADAGEMRIDGRAYAPLAPSAARAAGIAFIHQELNLFANLSIEENLFVEGFPRRAGLGPLIDRGAMRRRARALLEEVSLDLDPRTPLARLSQGERQLVEIAKALSREARLIIFDEPTTSLSRPEVARLFELIGRLKRRDIAIVYISHALEDVMRVCERVTVLRDGEVSGAGSSDELTLGEIITMMVGRPIETLFPTRARPAREEIVLEAIGLTQPGVAENVSFRLHAGEVLGIAGLMGSGRSELARMLFGLDPVARGEIVVCGQPLKTPSPPAAMRAGMAFLTEDRRGEGLLMEFSIADNIALTSLRDFRGALGLLDRAAISAAAGETALALGVSTERVDATRVKHLSGGNQQKVVIGKWLRREPRVFILDEPTRGIDVGAKQEVYRIVDELVARGSGVLLISSEIEELTGLSDRLLTLHRGEVVGRHERADFDRESIMSEATGLGPASGPASGGARDGHDGDPSRGGVASPALDPYARPPDASDGAGERQVPR